jgi:hypothetical protein
LNCSLANSIAKFLQLTVNPARAPPGILVVHLKYQSNKFALDLIGDATMLATGSPVKEKAA